MRCPLAVVVLVVALAVPAAAEPVRVRHPEGTSHGFVVVQDAGGKTIAHGELTQWPERRAMENRLVIRFNDGSLYDETVRFSHHPTFRLLKYHQIQRGPSFTETTDFEFDSSGRYRVRRKPSPDEDEQIASGTTTIPEDVYNGMTSTILKNLKPGAAATWHFLAFTPDPQVLEMHATPDGTERYTAGAITGSATRYRLKPQVTGLTGVVATVAGKQPEPVRMWIATGKAPTFLRFEGQLYNDGPTWRIALGAPRWR